MTSPTPRPLPQPERTESLQHVRVPQAPSERGGAPIAKGLPANFGVM